MGLPLFLNYGTKYLHSSSEYLKKTVCSSVKGKIKKKYYYIINKIKAQAHINKSL